MDRAVGRPVAALCRSVLPDPFDRHSALQLQEHPDGRREAEDEEAEARPQEREEEDGTASVPVGEPPEYRREDELHRRVGREQESDYARACVELRTLRVERQHGDDDAEADEVYEDRDEDDQQRRAAHLMAISC